ncbi:putative glutathione S-transferase, Thioredoxin-like superfamily [Helianthus anomalus]
MAAEIFQMGASNKTPEFLKMNPIGKIPVLETSEGPLFESYAIARYGKR